MNETDILDVLKEAIEVTIMVASPVMMVGLVVGVVIALLQALTQIQEATVAFVPKIMAIFASLIFFLPFMMHTMIAFTERIFDKFIGLQ